MSNVAKINRIKASRINRKKTKNSIKGIRKSRNRLNRTVTDLRRKPFLLEKDRKRLVATMKTHRVQYREKSSQETKEVRFTSEGIRSLRRKLHLTRAEFGKFVGISRYAVYLWEKKEGGLRLRDKNREALLSIRGLGAMEAKETLMETETKSKKGRKSRPKKRKRS